MISRETIDSIFSAVRIEEVVGDFVSLKRRGVNLLGLCPFHNEKTPSFTVSPAKGIYKCFGCGKAGNAVNFIMEHEHFTYPEALRYLAKKYGVAIEEEEQTPEMQQELNEKESLFNLNQFAQQYFSNVLHETREGKAIGLTYFQERGIREDVIRKFQLGFSPDPWDAFTKHALTNGYKKEYLLKSGLSLEKEERLYDRFHARVIFPIHSASGRVIGFGGRILGSDKSRAKYINSPESEVYNKSKSLYGLYLARNQIMQRDNCFLVEGYTDVISLHQAGLENVVASSGTSLTHEQIRLIQRYTNNITILYDGDPAGIKASLRGIDMIVEGGMNVKIVLFPDGEDPDSYARKHHPSEVEEFISKNSVNFILFKTKLLLAETEGDPIKKSALVREIVNTISLIPDGITRSLYIRECSAIMSVTEQVLFNEINKQLRAKVSKRLDEAGTPAEALPAPEAATLKAHYEYDPSSAEFQERELIRLLLLYGPDTLHFESADEHGKQQEIAVRIADFVVGDILQDELGFEVELFARIFAEFAAGMEETELPSREHFLSHPDPEIAKIAIDLIFNPHELSENWEKNNIHVPPEESVLKEAVISALHSFKARKIDRMILNIQKKLQETAEEAQQVLLISELKDLKEKSVLVNSRLGRIVTR